MLGARPTFEEVDEIFKKTRWVAIALGLFCVFVLLVVIPVSLQSQGVLDAGQAKGYVSIKHVYMS